MGLRPGQQETVSFTLGADDLAFYGQDMKRITEPGGFQAWIGGSSDAQLGVSFKLLEVKD